MIESKVLTVVKTNVTAKLGSKYPDINFTTRNAVPKNPKFPCVHIQKLSGAEVGRELEYGVVGIISDFQIDCYDATSQEIAEEVAYTVADVMCNTLGYGILTDPFNSNTDVYRNVARYRRYIGNDDTFLT